MIPLPAKLSMAPVYHHLNTHLNLNSDHDDTLKRKDIRHIWLSSYFTTQFALFLVDNTTNVFPAFHPMSWWKVLVSLLHQWMHFIVLPYFTCNEIMERFGILAAH